MNREFISVDGNLVKFSSSGTINYCSKTDWEKFVIIDKLLLQGASQQTIDELILIVYSDAYDEGYSSHEDF